MQFWSKFVSILFLTTVVFSGLNKHEVFDQTTNVITYDTYGYYLYLPAIFIYGQTANYEFVNTHFENYKIAGGPYQLSKLENGKTAPIYSGGMAILYSPFFFAADLYAVNSNRYARDGLSFPYQLGVVLATFFYVFIGIFFLRRVLTEYFTDSVAAVTLLLIGFGTNLFHYCAFESGMAHTFVFGLYAPLLWQFTRWHQSPNTRNSILIGLLSGLICLARPSEGILIFLFILFGIGIRFSLIEKFNFLIKKRVEIGLIILIGLLTISPQIIYWKANLDLWIFNGYSEEHHFDFLKPHIYNSLFSYRKGWLLYNPLMIFSLAGIFFLKKQKSEWFWSVLVFTVLSIYIIFSWHMWWYSSSFGNRGIVQIYPILAIGMAGFLTFLNTKAGWIKILFGIIATAFLGLNQFQDFQYRTRVLPLDGTTKLYYRKVFLKTKNQLPKDIRKFLYLDEDFPEGDYHYTTLAALPDSLQKNPPLKNLILPGKEFCFTLKKRLNKKAAGELSETHLRISTEINQFSDLFNRWNETKIVVTVERNKKAILWHQMPVQQFLEVGKPTQFNYEKQLPALQEGDLIKAYFWNKSPDTLEVRRFEMQSPAL